MWFFFCYSPTDLSSSPFAVWGRGIQGCSGGTDYDSTTVRRTRRSCRHICTCKKQRLPILVFLLNIEGEQKKNVKNVMSSMRYSRHFGCPNRKNAPVHLAQRRNPMREYEDRSLDVPWLSLYISRSLFFRSFSTTNHYVINVVTPHLAMPCVRTQGCIVEGSPPASSPSHSGTRAHTHIYRDQNKFRNGERAKREIGTEGGRG